MRRLHVMRSATFILIALLCLPGVTFGQSSIDRTALMELYNSTNGENWINNTNWGSENPIHEWYGVTQADAEGEFARVIDLRNNNLTGQLPTTWDGHIVEGGFRYLDTLILDGNAISGSIPPIISQISSLEVLSINQNNLSGTLPPELSELSSLVFLSFFDNGLTGQIPAGYFFMPNLQTLQLTFNELTGELPTGLAQNEVLRDVRLGFNQLSGAIPADIADGASINAIALAYNNLTGSIPAEIGGSETLVELDLAGNTLSGGIPPALGSLPSLTILGLEECGLTGTIPQELGNLSQLREVYLDFNQISGDVPTTFTNLTNLEILSLESNQLQSLPDLSGIVNLVTLSVSDNLFEFDDLLPHAGISSFFYAPQNQYGSPQNVEVTAGGSATLDASAQHADGNQYQWIKDGSPIPGATSITYDIFNADTDDEGLYSLRVTNPSLPELTLMSAEIFVSVEGILRTTDYDALLALYDATNGDNWTNNTNWGTEEPISEWFGVTESSEVPGTVETLDLRINNLSGTLPSAWASMIVDDGAFSNLANLLLQQNALTGSVPEQIGRLTNLRSISLHSNQFSGQIPVSFGDLDNLIDLRLGFNNLSGSIPPELGQLSSLQTLLLNNNSLSGSLPTELGDLGNLEILHVDQNSLSGDVPSSLATLPGLRELFVQTNSFESLPDFSGLPNLEILNVQNNFFQFDDLEPHINVPQFSYSPQQPFGETATHNLTEGDNLTLTFSVGGSANQYQWTNQTTPVDGATESTYEIVDAVLSDAGEYRLTVTSSIVPGLSLTSEPIVVNVSEGGGTRGEFIVTNTGDSGDGSLRAAIEAANSNPNEQGVLDEILFDIPGTGPHVIRPQSALPVITESVAVDAESQPGATCADTIENRTLQIVLDGSQAGSVEGGLVFRENQNTAIISGLVINNFSGAGVLVDQTHFTSIQCSFIGTDVDGTSAAPNIDGIHAIASSNVLIGAGSGPTGNLISGNSGYGVRLDGQSQAGGTVLYGNRIGTDRTGMSAVPNSIGIIVQNGSALIGAPDESESNLISGNSVRAVEVRGSSSAGTFLTNNLIGTNSAGTAPIPNGEGVRIHDGASGVIVGFFTDTNEAGFSNLIAFNSGPGVVVTGTSSVGNRISANRMFENEGLGIDLGDDGLTLNDIGDGDEGPNRLINSPQIVSSTIDNAGDLIVRYLVESGGQPLNIEFFEADVDGEEGARYLGMDTYFLNEAGQTVEFNLGNASTLGISDPEAIVATSTDNFANTSEFSGAGIGPGGDDRITVTEPENLDAVSGQEVQLQATLPSGFNATIQEVCYRRTGEPAFTCEQLQTSGDNLQGAIPSAFVTERGAQYYFRFSDGTTERTVPAGDPENSAFVVPVQINNLPAGGSFTPDTYRMVSIPIELSDASFTSVLDEYGEYDPLLWRLLRWEPTVQDYVEYPDLTGGFDPCEAYWLITFYDGDFEVENGQSVDPTEPCFVNVRPGWNQFSSPYAFPVAWSSVDLSGPVDGPVAFDASAGEDDPYDYNVDVLEPWQGYWLFNPGSSNVSMSFNPVEAAGKSGKNESGRWLAGNEYELRLRATLAEHGLVDSRNRIGLSSRASTGFDDLDFAEAPPIGDHVRLSILERDIRLAGSFRPDDGRGQSWDIEITGVVEGAPAHGVVRVGLDPFGQRPDGFGLRVVDLDEQQPVRVDADGFEVELTADHPVRRLRLIVGTDAFSEEAGESIPDVPQHAELAQNYPNPFNPSTRIRYQVHVDGPIEIAVFDPLGRRIRTLVDGNRQPGWYDTVWNGRDESGTAVSSGLYFYVLKTTDGSVSRTMVLLR